MITDDVVASVAAKLANLPKKHRGLTIGEAVDALKPQLVQARKDGYTLEELRTFLEENGVKASIATLKTYLGKGKQKRAGQREQRKERGNQNRSGQSIAGNAAAELESRKEHVEPAARADGKDSKTQDRDGNADTYTQRSAGKFQIKPDREHL